ncbi:MAG: UDP-2,3-diacylglucosamine hydrolase [Campylobacterales bacterium]|nr:UDP-2,3-diacylglucosamine hydrolase [Campylobacterales bacterium]
MSPDLFEIKEGALLISDAHYGALRPKLLPFLHDLASGRIDATQLILLGDIFDLLFGPIELTRQRNQEAIALINQIAQRMEVLYFEGNHDFLLEGVFAQVHIVPLAAQPLHVRFQGRDVWLSHGDHGGPLGYRLYTSLIRARWIMTIVGWIDRHSNHAIIRRLEDDSAAKEECRTLSDFESIVLRRYPPTHGEPICVIEGHYHQNRTIEHPHLRYINPGAFACYERYYVVKSSHDAIALEEHRYL